MIATQNSWRNLSMVMTILAVAAFSGCGGETGETSGPIEPSASPPPPPEVDIPDGNNYIPDATAKQRTEAGVGKSKKGRAKLPAYASTLVRVQERAIFEFSIPKAMQLHTTQFGKIKSHEEFMEKIIEANNLKLPELPEGAEYVFDVEKQVLMIEE